jgi:hypothetical protein
MIAVTAGAVKVMDDNGKRYEQDDIFERRLYQALALIERAGEQQRAAAAALERLGGLEQRLEQAIQAASAEAAVRIASEARSALDGAFADSAATLNQAARSAVAAVENLRWPWWLYLLVVLLASLLSAITSNWMAPRPDEAVYHQVDPQNQRLIDEGRTLEHVWPRLSRAEQKKLGRLAAQP